ncbi:hypothetical protein AAFF_G00330830 [Aldrovandia affinis]|uniref:Uncharacterized protein n=1 Tax=Aldrovandia affinis TaxID=143900 RepID=A0AAD7R6Y2_9TELE|nr:hypothetical protein AAFF_G00330830 [Aldrovandia affinis]
MGPSWSQRGQIQSLSVRLCCGGVGLQVECEVEALVSEGCCLLFLREPQGLTALAAWLGCAGTGWSQGAAQNAMLWSELPSLSAGTGHSALSTFLRLSTEATRCLHVTSPKALKPCR